jgi:hypothetical protein
MALSFANTQVIFGQLIYGDRVRDTITPGTANAARHGSDMPQYVKYSPLSAAILAMWYEADTVCFCYRSSSLAQEAMAKTE